MPLIHPEHLDQLAVREMPEPKILISDLLRQLSRAEERFAAHSQRVRNGLHRTVRLRQIDASAEFEPYAGSVSGAASRRLHPHG